MKSRTQYSNWSWDKGAGCFIQTPLPKVNWLRLFLFMLQPVVRRLAERATDHILLDNSLSVYEHDSMLGDCESIYAAQYKLERRQLLLRIKGEYQLKKRPISLLEYGTQYLALMDINEDSRQFGCSPFVSKGKRRKHSKDYVLRLMDENQRVRDDRYAETDPLAYYYRVYADDLGTRPKSVKRDVMLKSARNYSNSGLKGYRLSKRVHTPIPRELKKHWIARAVFNLAMIKAYAVAHS